MTLKRLTTAEKQTLLENLLYLVRAYEGDVQDAEQKLSEAQTYLDGNRTRLEQAKALVADAEERFGEELSVLASSPFAGLSLRDAAQQVIRGADGKALQDKEIIRRLVEQGFPFETEFPGRAIHAALIRVDEVQKVASGVYRWRNGKTN